MESKLNILLQKWPYCGIATSEWLDYLGIYKQLRNRYVASHWIESFGHGAFKRIGDTVAWEGALSAIQYQLKQSIHIGAKTALEFHGFAHFIPFHETQITLFSHYPLKLPKWFSQSKLHLKINYYSSSFLKTDVGIDEKNIRGFKLKISSPERAIFEVLFLTPHHQSIQESKYLMEGLRTLRPQMVQKLLDHCTSFKVKRLFLLLAEQEQLPCLEFLNLKNVKLGIGNRTLVKGGVLNKKYKITIPANLFSHEL